MSRAPIAFAFGGLLATTMCASGERALPACEDVTTTAALTASDASTSVSIVAVGDIADCNGGRQAAVAQTIAAIHPASVFALGDLVYPDGSLDQFLDCYAPSFGQFRDITHPVIGNHEYHTPHAGAYFAYFCGAAGTEFKGWYSFDIGRWHVVALNSNCGQDIDVAPNVTADFGGCDEGSLQVAWLRADLAQHPSQCKIAMWHHPRWSASSEGPTPDVQPFWHALTDYGVDVVLNGHAHNYQRFPPMNANGDPDPHGARAFVVGTGGSSFATFDDDARIRSEIRNDTTHGALQLDLRDGSYAWRFLPADGGTFTDSGEAPCHL